ncbi:SgcJ/EcaC family oxidoreductase [Sinorhizobium sp. B11]
MAFHELKTVIDAADRAIMAEDFDALMDLYDEQATLVIRPGLEVSGKEKIGKAFVAIADYFNHSLKITQDRMQVVEGGDTALVLAEAVLETTGADGVVSTITRRATYVFRRLDGKWLCVIDNSYGTDLLDEGRTTET